MLRRLCTLFLVGFMFMVLSGCGSRDKVYYAKYQSIGLFSPNDAKQYLASLNWGETLASLDKTSVVTNAKNEVITYLLVKRNADGKTGYVNQANIIRNPLSTAVILNQVVAYDSPSTMSMKKTMITPPTLCFLMEEKDKEWGKIEVYNIDNEYAIVPVTAKIYGGKWVQLKEISTKKEDVNIILSAGYALKNFNDAKNAYETAHTPANQDKLNNVIMTELESLKSQIASSPDSPAVIYAQQVLNVLSPSDTGTENQTEPEETVNTNEEL